MLAVRVRQAFRLNGSRMSVRCFSNMNGKDDETTHFGFQQVPLSEKARMVGDVFHGVADQYDLMNDLMSGGVHRLWKDHFVGSLRPVPGMSFLDVAGGTGDIAFRILDRIAENSNPSRMPSNPGFQLPEIPVLSCLSRMLNPLPFPPPSAHSHSHSESPMDDSEVKPSKIVVSDINSSMLDVGQARAANRGYLAKAESSNVNMQFVVADAENLPFADESFDVYTIAFGIRNCTKPEQVLKEAFRVLKKGGRFACLEFSKVDTPIVSQVYDLFSFNVIPVMGQLVANDRNSYQYLVESIRQFPSQETFLQMIRDTGFRAARFENLSFDVAAIHSGVKL